MHNSTRLQVRIAEQRKRQARMDEARDYAQGERVCVETLEYAPPMHWVPLLLVATWWLVIGAVIVGWRLGIL